MRELKKLEEATINESIFVEVEVVVEFYEIHRR